MDIFKHFEGVVLDALEKLSADGALPAGLNTNSLDTSPLDTSQISVEPPRDPAHGDLATNAAMILAAQIGAPPRDIAAKLVAELGKIEAFASVEIAGPGFINIRLKTVFWHRVVEAILEHGARFGGNDLGAGRKINLEYVSANPTGPMHVGHCRGAVFGDALANLLDVSGFHVTREYYINDSGAQVEALARSVHIRYRQALGQDVGAFPAGLYPGDYLIPTGESLARKCGDKLLDQPETAWLERVREFAVDAMMTEIKADLAALGIHHDVFFSERSLTSGGVDKISSSIEELESNGLIYNGKLPPPKGQIPEDWEDREQTLFKATAFGDDVDRPLMKSDGGYTYFAADIAYHKDKLDRGYDVLIDVWGADHGGYVKRMQSAVKAMSNGKVPLEVLLCQLVRLLRRGKPVKMSKRAGEFVTLREVIDEVGRDSVRFMMLYRKNDASLDFDFAKVSEQSRENPVFYVQYAHARIHSVLRNAVQMKGDLDLSDGSLKRADLGHLAHEAEIGLIRRLAIYPRIVEGAANAREPHRIAFYLYEVATGFHALWNMGKVTPQLRFICEDDDVTVARIALLHAVRHVIANGLKILGVTAVKEMK